MKTRPFSLTKTLLGAAFGATLALCGCVSVPNVDASKSSVAQMKRITVLAVREPPVVQVVNIGGAAGAFGVIGGLIQGSANADHSKAFLAAMVQRKVSLREPLLAAVESSLRQDGFDVSVDQTQWPKKTADGKSDDYSALHVDSDAILIVWFSVVGYMSPPNSTHYVPWVVIKARLLDARTKQDIYFKTFCVGYKMKVENAVQLPADPKYRFNSFDDLMAHVDGAVDGLVDCEKIAAMRMGSDLAR
jgi:hypothetical protein